MTRTEEIIRSGVRTNREGRVRVFIGQLSGYHYNGKFPREAFLLALSAGGMRVKDILALSLSEISVEQHEELSHGLRNCAWVFNTLCEHWLGFNELRSAYVQWAHGRSITFGSRTPAFFSRKCDGTLTCRSAERCIANAAKKLGLREWLTLREARALSKGLVPRRDLPSKILAFGDQADWLLRRSFRREVDFDDARASLVHL